MYIQRERQRQSEKEREKIEKDRYLYYKTEASERKKTMALPDCLSRNVDTSSTLELSAVTSSCVVKLSTAIDICVGESSSFKATFRTMLNDAETSKEKTCRKSWKTFFFQVQYLRIAGEIRGQCYKAFYSHKLRLFIMRVFVPGKPFQPSIMFAGKARSLNLSGAPENCFAWVGFGLARKH
jgi:hypothetical protein